MKKSLIVVMAVVLLTFSCKGNRVAGEGSENADSVEAAEPLDSAVDSMEMLITETPMPLAADELFDDFLFNFLANRKLQAERVHFPLPVTRNGKTTYLEQGQWQTDHFFMRQGYYTVLFDSRQQMELVNDTSVSSATVEKIYFNTGAVQQYRFRRIKGAWLLCSIVTEPLSANRNASFLEFYHRFVTDSLFQAQSLGESVQFSGPDSDDDFARMDGVITPDTWPAFAPELPDRMLYNIIYGEPQKPASQVIFLMRGIANGLEFELTFRNTDGRWKLFKYST